MSKGKVLVNNKKARHEYFIEEIFEAGMVLKGTEVKSIRKGKASIAEAYCSINEGEVFITGMHVSPYEQGNIYNQDPMRERKLLLHKKQIRDIHQEVKTAGYTLVPLNVKLVRGKVKMDIALAKGKKMYDKRESKKQHEDTRKIQRALKEYNR